MTVGRFIIVAGYIALVGSGIGCDPAAREKARREAASKAAEVGEATTQKVEDVKRAVEPYVDRAKAATTQAYRTATQRAEELAREAKPYVERAKSATTRAAERVRTATTQAVEEAR
jgi:adenylosuccinate synthase